MRTEQWIKSLGGHAGELYVAAELSKRGILSAILPKNFADDDVMIGDRKGTRIGYIQVKACHPDRANSFYLKEKNEEWINADDNQFVVLVSLGSPKTNGKPEYWVAKRKDVGKFCLTHSCHGTHNEERRVYIKNPKYPDASLELNENLKKWKEQWELFDDFLPKNKGD